MPKNKRTEEEMGDSCPVCGTKWTKTPMATVQGNYVHCLKCKKKADDILDEQPSKKPWTYTGSQVKGCSGLKYKGSTTDSTRDLFGMSQDDWDKWDQLWESDLDSIFE